MNPKKDSFQKSVEETSNRKCGNSTKAKIRCGYCNRGFHLEHAWMKSIIYQMEHVLQQNNLGGQVSKNAKKKALENLLNDKDK